MTDRNSGWIAVLVIILIIVFAGPFMFMGGMMGPGMMGSGMMGWNGYGYGYGIVFLGLIVFGVYYLISGGRPTTSGPATLGRSLEILKERYAKGEITKEEYGRMKQELTKED
ncbi:MAG: SHOCT domain-containing protein [Candidatus Bathyarchaeota archaeon]|nr:SHOCT domain-containing protein [Candidatus Bathyarchaeota archaeon]